MPSVTSFTAPIPRLERGRHHFSVTAAPEPGALIRVIEMFAKRGVVAHRCHAVIERAERERLIVDLQVDGLGPGTAEQIAESLRSLVLVELVLLARA